jgi:serine/threonine-protein kinase
MGVPYGSMGYGSPEQAAGEAVDHRSDIFSLGVVLYEMITGLPPFKGRNRIEVLHNVLTQSPRPVAQLNPNVPPGLEAILERALAKDPKDRYQTMAALRDELKALMRRLSRETGLVPTEASATLVAPQRARTSWFLAGALGRVFGRLRSGGSAALRRSGIHPAVVPSPGTTAVPRPPSWGTETKTTLAVVPFKNLAANLEASFYEFSLADGIITQLARLHSLVVRPSSYIAQYTGQTVDPRQVGEDLAVSFVLTGGFIKTGDRFRVTVQLLAAGSGEIVWSDTIDVPPADLITIQDAITERVVAGMRLKLTSEEQRQIEQPPTHSNEAYEFYLRGRDLLFRYTSRTMDAADLEEAIRMFHEAVGLDQDFAAAHAALGRCYVHHAQGYGGMEYYTLAERSLRRALELDAASTEARLQMVYVDLHHGDKERARATVDELLAEFPNDAAVVYVAAMLSRLDGLYERALTLYDHLLDINPGDVVLVGYNKARVFSYQRLYDRALAELARARTVEPEHPLVKTFTAVVLFNQDRVEEAQTLLEDVQRQNPHFDGVQPLVAWCLSARGAHEQARALITDRVRETAAADHDIAFWLASFYGMEEMVDEGVEWAVRSVRLGNENYPLFAGSHKLDSLRRDPRFVELLDELKQLWQARHGDTETDDGAEPS